MSHPTLKSSTRTELSWMRCLGNVWCKLALVNLKNRHFENMEGVYMIWHGGPNPHVVYVGQGIIRERIESHRSDSEIQQFARFGLYVTWAEVNSSKRDGIERYLAGRWEPIVGDKHPYVDPIEVNSPW